MKKTLNIISILIASFSFAQTTFNNTYNDTTGNYKLSFDDCNIIFEHKKSFYAVGTFEENDENSGGVYDGISDTTHVMLMSFNLDGSAKYRVFYTPNSCSSNNIYLDVDGDYLYGVGSTLSPKNFCGSYIVGNPPPGIDPVTKNRIFVTKTNLVTGAKQQQIFRTGVNSYPLGIIDNGSEKIIGNYLDDGSVGFLRIDSNLDSLNNKVVLDSVPPNYTPFFLDKIANGFWLGLTSTTDSHFELLSLNGDQTGTYVNLPFGITSMSKTSDNGYIVIENLNNSNSTTLAKLDSQLNVEWSKTYALYANNFAKQTKDGNYIIGIKDFAKVNKDSIIWQRRYFGPSNITPWYFLYDAIETSDNGFAITGFYDANTLLIKTDCMGNLVWDSSCTVIMDDTIKPVAIYPNPFKDEITFQLTDLAAPFTVRLVDMLGQVVFNQAVNNNIVTLNTSPLAAGVYAYCIYNGKTVYKKGKVVKI